MKTASEWGEPMIDDSSSFPLTIADSSENIPPGNIVLRSATRTPRPIEIVFKDRESMVLSIAQEGEIRVFDMVVAVDRGCYFQLYLWLAPFGLPAYTVFATAGGELRFERSDGSPTLRYDCATRTWFGSFEVYAPLIELRQLHDMRDVAHCFRIWVEDSFEASFGFRWMGSSSKNVHETARM